MSEKIIDISIPKGFKLLVEETFNANGRPVFVFENKNGQKLYAQLSDRESLERGFSWEFLLPSELESLKIEESYNKILYKNSKRISESGEMYVRE